MKYKSLMLVFLFCSVLICSGCLMENEGDRHLKHAVDFIELQMVDEAEVEINNSLRIKEKEKDFDQKPESYILRGTLFALERENEKAIAELELGTKQYGGNWDMIPLLASLYMQEKKYDKAIQLLEKMPDKDFGGTQLNVLEGLKYAKDGKYKKAIEYYEMAEKEFSEQRLRFNEESGALKIIQNGTYLILYDLMASAYEQGGALKKALEYYKRLEGVSPQIIGLKQKISIIQCKVKLEGNPNNALVWNSLGWEYYLSGLTGKAISAYNAAIKTNPSLSIAYNNLGLVYLNQKKYDEALPFFETVIKLDNDNQAKLYAFYNVGRVSRREGKCQKAVGYLEKAMKVNPSFDPARREYRIAMILIMSKAGPKQAYLDDLAEAYYENGEIENAQEIYQKLAKNNVKDYRVYLKLGNIYFEKQQYDKAKQYYEKSLSIKPDGWSVHEALACLFKVTKGYREAVEEYEKAIKNAPDGNLFELRDNLAFVYFMMGKNSSALEEWGKALKINTGKQPEKVEKINKIIKVLEG